MSGRVGQVKLAPMPAGRGRQRMWQSMRVLRQFTIADLAATTETPPNSVSHYVRALRDAGYVRCVQPVQSGRTAGHACYALVRDSGPAAPRIGNHGVRDANARPTHAVPMVSIARAEYERALRCIKVCEAIRAFGIEGNTVAKVAEALEIAR